MTSYTQFFTTADGVRIAYATMGRGLPLVYVPPFLSHLELMWEAPWFRSFNEALAEHFTLIRYDRYGCGLSDRDRTDFSFDCDVRILAALADHLRLRRFALLGCSDGGPVAVPYAVAHPRRVSHLLLYSFQWQPREPTPMDEALAQLMRADWRVGVNALVDYLLGPDADPDAVAWLARINREGASPETGIQLDAASKRVDLTELLPRLRVPTLVMSRQGDRVLERAREMATRIPGAHFVTLPGTAHIPEFDEPEAVIRAICGFISHSGSPRAAAPSADLDTDRPLGLSERELEVLHLVAAGLTNAEVADRLFVSPHTVNSHLTSVYAKLGVSGRAAAIRYALEHGLS